MSFIYILEQNIGIFVSTYFIYQIYLHLGRNDYRIIFDIIGFILGITLAIWSQKILNQEQQQQIILAI